MRPRTRHTRRGQTVMETAILLMIIVFAFVAMQVYLKRALQGRLKGSADQIGGQYDFTATSADYMSRHVSNTTTYSTTARMAVPEGTQAGDPIFDRSVSSMNTVMHYDNTFRNGYEEVLAP